MTSKDKPNGMYWCLSSEDKPFMVYEIYFSQKSSQAREEPGRNRILVRNIIALANSFQQNHDKK